MFVKLVCSAAALCMLFPVYSQIDTIPAQPLVDSLSIVDTLPSVEDSIQQLKTPVNKLRPAVDIPATAVGTAWSLYAFTKIYSKEPSSVE